MNRNTQSFNLGSLDAQKLFASLRILIFLATLYAFCAFCSITFHDIDPREVAQAYVDRFPLLDLLPRGILIFTGAVINPYGLRYAIGPLAAVVFILIAGSYYVKDVYALPHLKHAFDYVIASMFAIEYPGLDVDKGVRQVKKTEVNLIDRIGGPGFVSIEPGSAAIFRHLREPGISSISATHFLAPFETIAQTVDLDEQQGNKDEIRAVTRDGIVVMLRDVHVRYRIKQEVRDGTPVRRSLSDPYPLDKNALQNMLYNLLVGSDGLSQWNAAVEGAITGVITEFISSHSIDYLTAPRDGSVNPRVELVKELSSGVRRALDNLGAELLWADVGHLDILQGLVDDQRTDLWASDWVGDTAVSRAYTEAIRQAYQDLGRAQAQAEIILSISEALSSANMPNNTHENIRKMLLARTAQVLDALSTESTRPDKKSG